MTFFRSVAERTLRANTFRQLLPIAVQELAKARSRLVSCKAIDASTTILYRPVGEAELDLVAATGFRRFPLRLPDQPIFYPVSNEEYAAQIASR